jgi:hypothetical protein
MSWSLGYDHKWSRDIGYGVPAYCDHPNCLIEIDRGLLYVCCDSEPYGGERGCGLYFCEQHHDLNGRCESCRKRRKHTFLPTPDHPTWIKHKLKHASWKQWRTEHPEIVAQMKKRLD